MHKNLAGAYDNQVNGGPWLDSYMQSMQFVSQSMN